MYSNDYYKGNGVAGTTSCSVRKDTAGNIVRLRFDDLTEVDYPIIAIGG